MEKRWEARTASVWVRDTGIELAVTVVATAPHSQPHHFSSPSGGFGPWLLPQQFCPVSEMDSDSTSESEGCLLCLACLSTVLSVSSHTDTGVKTSFIVY